MCDESELQADETRRAVYTSGGDYAEGNIDKRQGLFVELRLAPGDSEAVLAAKRLRTRQLAANEVLVNLEQVNAWIAFARTALAADAVDPRLATLRRRIAPAAAEAAATGYSALIAAQQVAALRQAFNGRPISRDLSLALSDLLAETGGPAEELRFFVTQLAAFQDAAESLLGALASVGESLRQPEPVQQHYAAQRDLCLRVLGNRGQLAWLVSLRALHALGAPFAELQPRLDRLTQLEPHGPLSPEALLERLTVCVEEAEALHQERIALVAQAEELLAQSVQSYAELEVLLTVQPGDLWNVVIGKARSLRDLGRSADTVAAFARYAELFAATDPGATAYASAAQQLTLQLPSLGLTGAVYLYELVPGGAAERAGLQQGDVLTGYGDKQIEDMPALIDALQQSVVGTRVRVDYLRRNAQGVFVRHTTTIDGGPPGAGFMPI